jgi:hypothetical protein
MLLNEIHCIKEKSHIQNCFIGNKYYYVLHPESINEVVGYGPSNIRITVFVMEL